MVILKVWIKMINFLNFEFDYTNNKIWSQLANIYI